MNIIQPRRGKRYIVVIPSLMEDDRGKDVIDLLEKEYGIIVLGVFWIPTATAFQFIEAQENHNLAAITPGSLKK